MTSTDWYFDEDKFKDYNLRFLLHFNIGVNNEITSEAVLISEIENWLSSISPFFALFLSL